MTRNLKIAVLSLAVSLMAVPALAQDQQRDQTRLQDPQAQQLKDGTCAGTCDGTQKRLRAKDGTGKQLRSQLKAQKKLMNRNCDGTGPHGAGYRGGK